MREDFKAEFDTVEDGAEDKIYLVTFPDPTNTEEESFLKKLEKRLEKADPDIIKSQKTNALTFNEFESTSLNQEQLSEIVNKLKQETIEKQKIYNSRVFLFWALGKMTSTPDDTEFKRLMMALKKIGYIHLRILSYYPARNMQVEITRSNSDASTSSNAPAEASTAAPEGARARLTSTAAPEGPRACLTSTAAPEGAEVSNVDNTPSNS